MASASPLAETASPSPLVRPVDPFAADRGPDRWRWLRVLLVLPPAVLLIMQAQRSHVISPALDRLDPRLLEILTAVATGVFCHVLSDRLHRHGGVPRLAAVFLVVAPGLAITAAAPIGRWDLPSVIGLCLVVVALGGYLRFVVEAQTLGGFIAGITLALAAVSDLATLGYMAAFAAAVPFVAGAWARQVSATTAILAVLAFPSVAVYLGWLYIRWRFAGSFGAAGAVPEPAAVDPLRGLLAAANGLLHAPLYVAVGVGLARRRLSALPAYLLPLAVIALLAAAGVRQSPLVINLFYTAVAVTAVQLRLSRREWAGLTTIAAAQAVLTLFSTPIWYD